MLLAHRRDQAGVNRREFLRLLVVRILSTFMIGGWPRRANSESTSSPISINSL
jgi:hypothetical protein